MFLMIFRGFRKNGHPCRNTCGNLGFKVILQNLTPYFGAEVKNKMYAGKCDCVWTAY